MQWRTLAAGITLGAAAALITSQAVSQDAPTPPAEPAAVPQVTEEQMAEMMKEWQRLIQPGPMHELLKKFVGTWDTTTQMYWGGPGSEAIVTNGTSTRKLILGGRFLMQEENSEMKLPNAGSDELTAVPWQGVGLFGFDNYRGMYHGCWADNMGTHMLTMKGMADPTGKVFTYYGDMDEPMLGIVGRTVKYVATFIDDDTQTFEVYDLHAGENYLVSRVTYKRRASDEPAKDE